MIGARFNRIILKKRELLIFDSLVSLYLAVKPWQIYTAELYNVTSWDRRKRRYRRSVVMAELH